MMKINIDRGKLDHPEHFDDEIREYKGSSRYKPTPLEQLLYELSSHRCTICSAPWLEIHHIDELSTGGKTEYENLIVLCPNCHTRVHAEGKPDKQELRHYKLKQEIAYELPVVSKLSKDECELINNLAHMESYQIVTHIIPWMLQNENSKNFREKNYIYLVETGILSLDPGIPFYDSDSNKSQLGSSLTVSGKGMKWIIYLAKTNRLPNITDG